MSSTARRYLVQVNFFPPTRLLRPCTPFEAIAYKTDLGFYDPITGICACENKFIYRLVFFTDTGNNLAQSSQGISNCSTFIFPTLVVYGPLPKLLHPRLSTDRTINKLDSRKVLLVPRVEISLPPLRTEIEHRDFQPQSPVESW